MLCAKPNHGQKPNWKFAHSFLYSVLDRFTKVQTFVPFLGIVEITALKQTVLSVSILEGYAMAIKDHY